MLIVQNPMAGAGSGARVVGRLAELLTEQGLWPEVVHGLTHFSDKLWRYRESGELRVVVAAGGDGTVGAILNNAPPDVPLAVCPLGTENLLAKQLGLTADPAMLCRVICRSEQVQIDAGLANGRLFLLMAGCGFDGDVVRRLHGRRRGHIRRLSYAKPILDSVRSYRYPELRVYCEPLSAFGGLREPGDTSREELISARWVFIVNLPRYAGGLRIARRACGSDGLLDVCTFRNGSLLSGLCYLAGVALGRHEEWDGFVTRRVARLRIEADEPVPYQIDGDPGGDLPLEIRVIPARAKVLVPECSSAANRPGCEFRPSGLFSPP